MNQQPGEQQGPSSSSYSYQQLPPPATVQGGAAAGFSVLHQPAPNYQTMPNQPSFQTGYLGNPQFNGFNEKRIRADFVSKVFSIVALQVVFAAAVIAFVVLHEPTRLYMQDWSNTWALAGSLVALVVFMVMVCVDSARRTFPINICLLALLTLSFSVMLGAVSVRYDTYTILCAAGSTAVAVVAIVIMAKFCPFDITGCGCGLLILGLVHLLVSIILVISLVPTYASTASLLIAGSGAFLVSLYMLFDLQLIMGGRHAELSPEEHVLAAAMLFIDIVSIFQYMLIIFGRAN